MIRDTELVKNDVQIEARRALYADLKRKMESSIILILRAPQISPRLRIYKELKSNV
jgi:hypothetical protein